MLLYYVWGNKTQKGNKQNEKSPQIGKELSLIDFPGMLVYIHLNFLHIAGVK